eukprot:2673314-Prymnesium_polylepis.2
MPWECHSAVLPRVCGTADGSRCGHAHANSWTTAAVVNASSLLFYHEHHDPSQPHDLYAAWDPADDGYLYSALRPCGGNGSGAGV